MTDLLPITIEDLIACAERELLMREQVYPRRVGQRLMRQSRADREIALMRAIIEQLQRDKGSR